MNKFERTLIENLLDTDPERLRTNSFKSYHAVGLDYVNLQRSPELTIKAYIVRTPIATDIVNPHNHAYDSTTFILKGKLQNVLYTPNPSGRLLNRFNYLPASNGNSGEFEFVETQRLIENDKTRTYGSGEQFSLRHKDIHTIRAFTPEVLMLQFQYKNKAPEGTSLWLKEREVPDTSNLYKPWDPQDFEENLKLIRSILD